MFFFCINFHTILAFKFCPACILQKVKQLNTVSPQVSGYSVNSLILTAQKHTNNSDDQLVMEQRWSIDHIITFSTVCAPASDTLCSRRKQQQTTSLSPASSETVAAYKWFGTHTELSASSLHSCQISIFLSAARQGEVSKENHFYLSLSLVCFQSDGNTQLLQVQGWMWQMECHLLSLEFDNGIFFFFCFF